MKKLIVTSVLIALVALFNMQPTAAQKQITAKNAKIEVYYFHFTHRCTTCETVEAEAKKDIIALYPKLFKAGKITFASINLEEKNSKTLAEKHNVEGQSLLIISGDKKIDLTDKAFMYAVNSPEKLKAEIKNAIDGLIK